MCASKASYTENNNIQKKRRGHGRHEQYKRRRDVCTKRRSRDGRECSHQTVEERAPAYLRMCRGEGSPERAEGKGEDRERWREGRRKERQARMGGRGSSLLTEAVRVGCASFFMNAAVRGCVMFYVYLCVYVTSVKYV